MNVTPRVFLLVGGRTDPPAARRRRDSSRRLVPPRVAANSMNALQQPRVGDARASAGA
jgi:hypothetical protein